MKNVWEEALFNLSKAAEAMDLEPEILERLSVPMRFTEFTIPVRMDNGARKLFLAFRSCHQDATGPTKDGTRVRPGLTPEEIKALSLFMSIKHGVAGIPAGGGKGGIRAGSVRPERGGVRAAYPGIHPEAEPEGGLHGHSRSGYRHGKTGHGLDAG